MKPRTLEEIEEEWEEGLEVVTETRIGDDEILRVLKPGPDIDYETEPYHLHHLFSYNPNAPDKWSLSVERRGDPETVMSELLRQLGNTEASSQGRDLDSVNFKNVEG